MKMFSDKVLKKIFLKQLESLAIKVTETAKTKCCFGLAFYETKFPEELLEEVLKETKDNIY
ncbi:cyclic lactone autoinducer peptide [Clostridium perfringens]|uniref:AgrD family cyclic lactone autoinducer peptide n=1 Tax=Clostridium perfringens TaxID=1502 RepID=UPI001A1C6138|nr:cyclic lactone autoinducer peptide [Clostridium perfringens]MBO3326923.1 cyclic lactone autoinducer peptide [Clostridium perfringens]HAT4356453.1 cyclic lactone autoinducer peptide [Clostridium perfringens]